VVQDIIAISEYLKEGLSTVDTTILTATKLHQDEAVIPIETPGRLPSPGNVTLSFKRILDLAKPGNHVYIHYSGHGTRRNFDGAVALRAHPQKSVFLGHFAKKRMPNPILCLLSYSLNRFKRVLKLTLASLIIYI
jgi:hypothetical protein